MVVKQIYNNNYHHQLQQRRGLLLTSLLLSKSLFIVVTLCCIQNIDCFQVVRCPLVDVKRIQTNSLLKANKGFGGGGGKSAGGFGKKSSSAEKKTGRNRLKDTLSDVKPTKSKSKSKARPYRKDEQDEMLEQLAQQSASTPIGRAVAEFNDKIDDPFWQLMPSLISSRFPKITNEEQVRIAEFVKHTLQTTTSGIPQRPIDWIDNPYRPYDELHAYMPNLGITKPFHDTKQLQLCQLLEENYEIIKNEYYALLNNNMNDKFQSVTSMNYDSGWKTLVLFYNGHRIAGFPYHLCPVTTKILESVPLAGRIAGFNRQQPMSGIPKHTDGNNMWLTCQMGIEIPDGDKSAYIRVANETQYWKEGECILYDTTYIHETMNTHPTQERVVLHVDFFNTLSMTSIEIDIMQYIYTLREEFMKAEGIAKVGAQIL